MAVVRRIYITEFKEVEVQIPSGKYEDLRRDYDYNVLPPDPNIGGIGSISPRRITVYSYGLDDWGFYASSGKQIFPDDTDSNNDGIPDYLSLDVDGDGMEDGFGSQDFIGVITKSYLLGKIRIIDYTDINKNTDQIYNDAINGIIPNYQFNEPAGWVVLAESKPSFYYEECIKTYGSNMYYGRVPVSINYFDLDDIWVNENINRSWNLVLGEGGNPLQIVGNVNIYEPSNPVMAQNGFDFNFGPELDIMPNRLEMKFIQQYIPFVINEYGQVMFPNVTRNMKTNLSVIKTKVEPVNLHMATRFDILTNTENLNESSTSERPYNEYYYSLFPNVPTIISFSDGKQRRWGRPRLAIGRGFLVNGNKNKGNCIPIPNDVRQPLDDTSIKDRTLVTIREVLSGKVKMDGTNYIKGIVTAHFTFPIISSTMQDIADIYYAYDDQRKKGVQLNHSEFGLVSPDLHVSDILTFGREMRSAVYVQDDTAAMELLGTDFYSTEGLEFKTAPGQIVIDGEIFTGFSSTSKVQRLMWDQLLTGGGGSGGSKGIYDEMARIVLEKEESPNRFNPDAPFSQETSHPLWNDTAAFLPTKEYWENDTGYLPSRYHFKVGDFIEIYNLNILRRSYASRTCKLVNNDYKIIPNDTPDVMKYFEENGYIKDVELKDLYKGPKLQERGTRRRFEETLNWFKYDYSDLDSIHKTEHCLIRIKNVGFLNTDSFYSGGSLLEPQFQLSIYRNDDNPIIYSDSLDKSQWDDWGIRFEPNRKYVICDLNDVGNDKNFVGGNISSPSRIFLYNSPSTEMSEYLLKIPGKNLGTSSRPINKEYIDWLSTKRKSDPSGSKYDNYKWPLDIIGIQKFVQPNDYFGDSSYMIMTRTMSDLGITSDMYDLLRPIDNSTSIVTPNKDDSNKNGDKKSKGDGTSTGGSGGSTCFDKGTLVLTPSGYKTIESIIVGDVVITFDLDLNLYERKVIRTYIHDKEESSDIYRYEFCNGNIINVTENHPFLSTDKQFVKIGGLKVGESVLMKDGNNTRIVSKKFLRNDTVYNIEVEEFNAYIVNEICVHNLTKNPPNLRDIIVDTGPTDIGSPFGP